MYALRKCVLFEVSKVLELLGFDICSIAILIILLFALEFRKTVTDEASKKLVRLVLVTVCAAIFDIFVNYNNGKSDNYFANYVCAGLYFAFRNAAFYMYASYIITVTRTRHQITNPLLGLVRFVPFAVMCAIVTTTPYTGIFYYFDINNHYIRGDFFQVIYVCSAVYCIFAFGYVLANLPIIGIGKSISLISCAVFSLAASIIQYFYPYLMIDILGFTLSLLFIVLFIDNPGDKIESTSLLLRYQSYIDDLKKSFYIKSPVDIIHINIRNHRSIEEMLSYANYLEFIREVSERLVEANNTVRAGGELYYLKDGKFRVVMSGNEEHRTNAMAKACLEAFNKEVFINDMGFSVESSICVTSCPGDFGYIDELFDFAAVADMFEKPGEICYSKDILQKENYNGQVNISKKVEHGIVNNRFEVFYQPIYNVRNGKFDNVEALLRLYDEDNRIWGPETFLQVAEQNGSVIELGEFVLEEVCKFIGSPEFEEAGIKGVGVNLSVVQCLQKNLPKQTVGLLEKYNISAKRIMFEVTESMATDTQDTFESNIKYLSEEGIGFVLDDYGTGYSNITTLSSMPLTAIKFDKSFAMAEENEKLKTVFEKSLEMVKALGKSIVIEGVETKEQADRFVSLGSDYLQGTYFAQPMTKSRLIEFYENNK